MSGEIEQIWRVFRYFRWVSYITNYQDVSLYIIRITIYHQLSPYVTVYHNISSYIIRITISSWVPKLGRVLFFDLRLRVSWPFVPCNDGRRPGRHSVQSPLLETVPVGAPRFGAGPGSWPKGHGVSACVVWIVVMVMCWYLKSGLVFMVLWNILHDVLFWIKSSSFSETLSLDTTSLQFGTRYPQNFAGWHPGSEPLPSYRDLSESTIPRGTFRVMPLISLVVQIHVGILGSTWTYLAKTWSSHRNRKLEPSVFSQLASRKKYNTVWICFHVLDAKNKVRTDIHGTFLLTYIADWIFLSHLCRNN